MMDKVIEKFHNDTLLAHYLITVKFGIWENSSKQNFGKLT